MIVWRDIDGYRNVMAEDGDYELIIMGGKKYEFNWAVFHKKVQILCSQYPCRSVNEAQRICFAIYQLHKSLNNHHYIKGR